MGTPLVIVESPAKARTISRFLGDDYRVEASIGHIRDLVTTHKDKPLGVDTENGFKPIYVVPKEKKAQVKQLREAVQGASALYLATDEDREGESISWHLLQVLKPDVPVFRLVFHEITVGAIQKALQSPRSVDESLVQAQEARRIVDRLFGYPVSKLLWQKVGPKRLSAGRVQSVAVRLVVDRERSRMAHTSADWWDIRGPFQHAEGTFDAHLTRAGTPIATDRNFDADGKLKSKNLVIMNKEQATATVKALSNGAADVVSVDERPYQDSPSPPVHDLDPPAGGQPSLQVGSEEDDERGPATLREQADHLHAYRLSVSVGPRPIAAARGLIQKEYGDAYMPESPRLYKGKAKNAQEAHEAIRPSGEQFRTPGRGRAARVRRVALVRTHLEANSRLSDVECSRTDHHGSGEGWRGTVRGQGQDDRVRGIPACIRRRPRRS